MKEKWTLAWSGNIGSHLCAIKDEEKKGSSFDLRQVSQSQQPFAMDKSHCKKQPLLIKLQQYSSVVFSLSLMFCFSQNS